MDCLAVAVPVPGARVQTCPVLSRTLLRRHETDLQSNEPAPDACLFVAGRPKETGG